MPAGVADHVRTALASVADVTSAGAVWRALGDHGVLRAVLADGPRPAELGALLTELDRVCPVGVVLSVCVQVATLLPILRDETGVAREVYRAALAGTELLALAVTDEAAAGSELTRLGTTAKLAEETVTVNGGKRWITNACTAGHALVLARHRPSEHFTSFLWVLLPTTAAGVRARPATGDLFAGSGVGHLDFTDVRVGRDHVVGAVGRGLVSFGRHVTTERLAGGLWAAAMCRRVLAGTLTVLRDRQFGGKTLWDNDAVRYRFARCLLETRRIEALCARHEPGSLADSMVLKASAGMSLDRVLAECVELTGADAFADDGLARLRAEAGMFGIAGGASGAMLAGIADHATELLGV